MTELRHREGFFPQLVRSLGSIELAMLLLGVLAVGCAIATFAESRFDARAAQIWIYDAPWFHAWLLLLCLNLFFATVSRWPWQKRHAGFVITHAGIITLLAGAWIGRAFGVEGFAELRKGEMPINRLVTGEMTVLARSPKTGTVYSLEYDPTAKKPTERRPRKLALPETDLRLVVDRYAEHLDLSVELVPAPAGQGAPGLVVRLKSGMLPQPIEASLLLGDPEHAVFNFFGMGAILWVEKLVKTPPTEAPLTLRLASAGGGKIAWQSWRSGKLANQGVASEGKSFATGWADWQAEILRLLPSAQIEERVREMPSDAAHAGTPAGLRARLVEPSGKSGAPAWVLDGRWRDLEAGTNVITVGFGGRTRGLPFWVGLESFSVPRAEGTDRPENFISTLRFMDDPHQPGYSARIEMNHPAEYPAGWWRSALGLNYKFSQSSWDPDDLDRTTLQVLRDPGWPLKWIGSILVVAGIFIVFAVRGQRADLATAQTQISKP
ncbi:MAG: hypothetical protein IT578_05745 [Verrucomicrobiae bacterium]|nr:hypothetical protein [Verrucomicrobiae bacterium]